MKIWVIGRNYPEPSNNMSGSFEIEQAKMLQKYGNNVQYICCSFHPIKKIKNWGYQCWEEEGVRIHTNSFFFFPRIYPLYFIQLRNYYWKKFLYQIYEEEGKPDLIHIHYPAMLMLSETLRFFHNQGIKIVITEHWSKILTNELDRIERTQYIEYFKYISACICVGSSLAKAVRKIVGDSNIPIHIIPNVTGEEFRPALSTNNIFEFIAVGRLTEIKQFDRIIKVFSENFRGKKAQLTIIGGGEKYQLLQKMISELSMEHQICLTGTLSKKEVALRMASASCLVCYIKFETFCVPIIEAWACGIPVISTVMEATDRFDSKLGIKVSCADMGELGKAMTYIYKNIEFYDKKYISKFSDAMFSEKAVYEKLMEVYQKMGE